MVVSGGAVTTLMIGTTVGTGGGETIGTTPTGSGRAEGGEATTAGGMITGEGGERVTKETVEVDGVTLG